MESQFCWDRFLNFEPHNYCYNDAKLPGYKRVHSNSLSRWYSICILFLFLWTLTCLEKSDEKKPNMKSVLWYLYGSPSSPCNFDCDHSRDIWHLFWTLLNDERWREQVTKKFEKCIVRSYRVTRCYRESYNRLRFRAYKALTRPLSLHKPLYFSHFLPCRPQYLLSDVESFVFFIFSLSSLMLFFFFSSSISSSLSK